MAGGLIQLSAGSGLLGGLLGIAAAADVAGRRIPNPVSGCVVAAGLAVQWTAGGPEAVGAAFAGGLGVLLLLFLPWTAGWLGGGDVKLAAATATWLAPTQLLPFLAFSAVAGAPVAAVTWLAGAPGARRNSVPMAVAFALGAFAALTWRWP